MKTIYLSGAITGNPNCEKQFAEAAKTYGEKAINPCLNYGGDRSIPWYIYMAKSIYQLTDKGTKKVVMLEGWTESKGAIIEWLIAMGIGLDVEYTGEQPTPKIWGYFHQAKPIVYSDRQYQYGHPKETYGRVAEMKATRFSITYIPGRHPVYTESVLIDYIFGKVSREFHSHKDDNLIDIAGYALCIRLLREGD